MNRRMGFLVVGVVGLFTGCGPVNVSGSMDGDPLTFVAGQAMVGELFGTPLFMASLHTFDYAQAEEVSPADLEGAADLILLTKVQAGEFTVVSPEATSAPETAARVQRGRYKQVRCEGDTVQFEAEGGYADSGTLTLESTPEAGKEVRGSLEARFGEDVVSGSFTLLVEDTEEPTTVQDVKCVE